MPSEDFYDGVRAAIEALPDHNFTVIAGGHAAHRQAVIIECRDVITRLLPKPDPAKVLVEKWSETLFEGQYVGRPEEVAGLFARWLLDNGLIDQGVVGEG